jgi:poly(A) polymerase
MSLPAIPHEQIDADAQKVIRHLVRNGYQAYLVGGCVRDLLLERTPKDFDVTTNATPAEIRDLFRNCRIIGRRFRLAHVVFGRKIIETATFRANPRPDGLDSDVEGAPDASGDVFIHRDNVFGTAEEDARRRDFTINGLFYDIEGAKVIDYVDGLDDLRQRHLRTIGDPNLRFREDPVRILRAVKFAARLSFDVEDHTYRSMISHHGEVMKSAAPRVLEEIYRLLRGGAAVESMVLLSEIGLLRLLLPEVSEWLRDRPAALDPYLAVLDERVRLGE